MKTLFLVALIISCASADTLTVVPSLLLGTWNLISSQGNCYFGNGCLVESMAISAGGDTTLSVNVMGSGCSQLLTIPNVSATGTLTVDTEENYSLTSADGSDFDVTMTLNSSGGLPLMATLFDTCYGDFSKGNNSPNSAFLIKSTIGAVSAAAIMFM